MKDIYCLKIVLEEISIIMEDLTLDNGKFIAFEIGENFKKIKRSFKLVIKS